MAVRTVTILPMDNLLIGQLAQLQFTYAIVVNANFSKTS
jgi:hypothetical protein